MIEIIIRSFIVIIVITISNCLTSMLRDKIKDLKYKYKYKHIFDKKPIAKCYCKDCVYQYDKCEGKYCTENDRYVASDWFCHKATPHTCDPGKE